MSVLRVSLLGQVQVVHAAQASPVKVTRIVQGLLAFLLLQRHRYHPREALAGLFWGDHSQERARCCLNTALWRLRRVLEPEGIPRGTYLLTTSTGEVGFNEMSDHWLDVAAFEEQSGQVLAKPVQAMEMADAQTLENALQLYTGELLEGYYDDWAIRERERLRRLYLNSLGHLMQYYKHHKAYEESLSYGQQILNLDPLREEIHREMMRLYLASGQRPLVVQQYKLCCEILSSELGIPPMEETQALYVQIMDELTHRRAPTMPMRDLPGFPQALQGLQVATKDVDEAWGQLQQAIQLIEQLAHSNDQGPPLVE